MTPQVARFVAEYLVDFNATQAAIRAGYSAKSAKQIGSRLLTRVDVKAAIAPKQEEAKAEQVAQIQQYLLSAERTKLEIARLAYFDPRRLFNPDGSPKSITELDDDTAAGVAGLEVMEEFEGAGRDRVFVGFVKKYRLADKNAALDKAAKIAGLYELDNKQARTVVSIRDLTGRK